MFSVYDVFKELEREQQIQTFAEGEETIDSNNYCMLESDTTRKILIPEKYSIFGVESDEKVKTVKFAFPRYVDDGRLDLMNYKIRINYKTANPDEENNKDQTQAQNVHAVGDYVVFEWLLSRRVTQYRGTITFIVCAITANDDGTITTEWNTTIATSQSIEGMEVSPNENEEQQARDLLTELLVSLNNSKNDAITEITQTKTQAISDVQAEGQTQTEAVDAKGAQVLESIPDDYTTLENRVDELEQNRAYVIVGESSGEFITLNDSSELKTRNVKLFGKSVQKQTNGYNLFDLKHFVDLINEHTVESGCSAEILDYATGTFKITHPRIEYNSYVSLGFTTDSALKNLQNTRVYYSSANNDITSSGYLFISAQIDTTSFSHIFNDSSYTFLNGIDVVLYNKRNIITGTETVYKNLFLANTSNNKTFLNRNYEVYTGGEAATEPTPDYPLPITSAGIYDDESEKYEIGIGVTGKNLFNASKLPTKTQGGATVTNNGDGSFTVSGSGNITGSYYQNIYDYTHEETIKMLSVGDLSLSEDSNTEPYVIVQLKIGKSTNVGDAILQLARGQTKQITKEMLMNPKSFLRVQIFGGSGRPIIPGTIKPVLYQEGNGTFEPFKQQLSTLQIPNPLRGIPVDSGGNYTDSEGQQWLCDYIDRERGKYVQCVQKIVFDGSEDEGWFYQSDTNTFALGDFGGEGVKNRVCICDRFFSKQGINPQGVNYLCCGFNPAPEYSDYFYFKSIGEVHFTLVSDFKRWLSNNPTTIIYQLKNPTETDLTSEQLAALNLSTYQGITNIGTDTMPQVGIDVEYIADTKTYIDNAIAEAIATIPTE